MWGTVLVVAVAGTAWIALEPVPARGGDGRQRPWITVAGDGFKVDLPGAPVTSVVGRGTAHVTTASAGGGAFSVVWFGVPAGVQPVVALVRALQALAGGPANVISAQASRTGPFQSAEVTARLPPAFLHGRLLVVGRRAYLVAELGPSEVPPPQLERLLRSFDPDVGAGAT